MAPREWEGWAAGDGGVPMDRGTDAGIVESAGVTSDDRHRSRGLDRAEVLEESGDEVGGLWRATPPGPGPPSHGKLSVCLASAVEALNSKERLGVDVKRNHTLSPSSSTPSDRGQGQKTGGLALRGGTRQAPCQKRGKRQEQDCDWPRKPSKEPQVADGSWVRGNRIGLGERGGGGGRAHCSKFREACVESLCHSSLSSLKAAATASAVRALFARRRRRGVQHTIRTECCCFALGWSRKLHEASLMSDVRDTIPDNFGGRSQGRRRRRRGRRRLTRNQSCAVPPSASGLHLPAISGQSIRDGRSRKEEKGQCPVARRPRVVSLGSRRPLSGLLAARKRPLPGMSTASDGLSTARSRRLKTRAFGRSGIRPALDAWAAPGPWACPGAGATGRDGDGEGRVGVTRLLGSPPVSRMSRCHARDETCQLARGIGAK